MRKINWLRFKYFYFFLSGTLIVVALFGLVKWRLNLGVDFVGGSVVEYKIENSPSTGDLVNKLKEENINVYVVQKTGDGTYLFKLSYFSEDDKGKLSAVLKDIVGQEPVEIRFENVGPSIGAEMVKKTSFAVALASGFILIWVGFQFKSFKFGVAAILAMFHDTLILVGAFSWLGNFFGAQLDFLIVTAVLTTLSFSVHDTIVVFDRIREIHKKSGGALVEIGNQALTETMRRSINNSLTIIFVLAALVIMGGTSIRWFGVALLIGTILGTYSSPFVAVPLLVIWEGVEKKFRKYFIYHSGG